MEALRGRPALVLRAARLVLGLLLAVGILNAACASPSSSQPADAVHSIPPADSAPRVGNDATADATPTPTVLAPLVTDPPATARAAHAADATYATYQGLVCGVVPRPDYGYTVRYPKIWMAREQGATTWLADHTDDDRLVGVVEAAPAPPDGEDLARLVADGWHARQLDDLRLDPVDGARIGGQPAARWDVQFRSDDGTSMIGYTAATVAHGRLYRVEVALPAARHQQLARAAAIVADQLIIAGPKSGG